MGTPNDIEDAGEDATTVARPDITKLGKAISTTPDFRAVATVGLFVLGTLYTLHFARSFFIPIVLALLLDFLLSPVVRALRRAGIPEPASAALLIVALLGGAGLTVYRLADPAKSWIARAPESLQRVEDRLARLRRPVEEVSKAAERVEEATAMGGGAARDGIQEVQLRGPSLSEQVFGGTADFLTGLTVVVFLLFFLLAAGDLFLQKLIRVLPQFSDKKKAVAIARETEAQVSTYLFTMTLINAGVGVVTGVAMYLVGLPNPALWGIVAGLLNFVPYVGALVNVIVLALAALVTFDEPFRILLVPGVFLVINLFEGNLITPMILGRRLTLNPVAVFIGLIFWWYLWGIPGALLAVPMVATFKIVCDHIESLAPVGEFLGR